MQRKKRRQPKQDFYHQLLIEVLIILVIWTVAQGDPHNILQSLIHLLQGLS